LEVALKERTPQLKAKAMGHFVESGQADISSFFLRLENA
jgi:hypothetical protein